MKHKNRHSQILKSLVASLALLLVAGCATTPEPNPALDKAQADVQAAASDTDVKRYAPQQLDDAQAALRRAEGLYADDAAPLEVNHYAYLASTRAETAIVTADLKEGEEMIDQLSVEREKVVLEARAMRAEMAAQGARAEALEAQLAKERAEFDRVQAELARAEANTEADLARTDAQVARADAAQAREQSQLAQQEAEQARLAALNAQQRAAEAEAAQAEAMAMVNDLRMAVDELQARQTPRGLVLTLGDVLFDFDKATLKPGADRIMDRLAEFMEEYPERNVLVEGFTDSVGSEQYNLGLSQRRAGSVENALIERGIDSARIETRGFGEQYPVASNDTDEGRQQNRRVEVIISDQQGDIPPRS